MSNDPGSVGPRRVFVHVHVPKNAGTSFDKVLHRNFRGAFARDYNLVETLDTRYTAADFGRVLDLHPFLRAYASHRISADLPYDRPDAHLVALAFVRDPVDRFLSHYFFARTSPSAYSPLAQRVTLPEYIRLAEKGEIHGPAETVHTTYATSQTAFLAGERGPAGVAKLAPLVAADRLLLLPTERFDDACLLLEALFPEDFTDCSYPGRMNVSRQDQDVTPDDRDAIRDLVADDYEVLQLAREAFDQRFRALFPEGGRNWQRTKHSLRCRARASIAAVEALFKKRKKPKRAA